MSGLNSILSGAYSSVGLVRGDVGASTPSRQEFQVRPLGGEGDVFESGQWWKNRAVSGEDSSLSASGCRCGSCHLCAGKVYSDQGKSANPLLPGEKLNETASEEKVGNAGQASVEQGVGLAEDNKEEAAFSMTQVKGSDDEPISQEELAYLTELKNVDAEVRAHEQAHLAAAGGLAKGGASFSYKRGPDGQNYAVGGEVQIDTSRGATPEETLAKMMKVRAAALAPSSPSSQDRKVAAAASSAMSEARLAVKAEKFEEFKASEGGNIRVAGEQVSSENEEDSGGVAAVENSSGKVKSGVYARAASVYQSVSQRQGALNFSV